GPHLLVLQHEALAHGFDRVRGVPRIRWYRANSRLADPHATNLARPPDEVHVDIPVALLGVAEGSCGVGLPGPVRGCSGAELPSAERKTAVERIARQRQDADVGTSYPGVRRAVFDANQGPP